MGVPEEVLKRIQRIINPTEFSLLLCGLTELNAEDWRANSTCSDGTIAATWEHFWKVVAGLNQQQRSELLEFSSGSSTLPVGGFAALPGYGGPGRMHKFTVAPPRHHGHGLPTAATCFNTIYLPSYGSEAEMRAAILEAVAHRNAGFYE